MSIESAVYNPVEGLNVVPIEPLSILLHGSVLLTHWGRVTHICVNELTTIGSDNGLSPGRQY